MTTMTSREFNRDVSAAKRAALEEPVVVTDNGTPSHVLLSIAEYQRMRRRAGTLADRLVSPETADIDLPLPAREVEPSRDVGL